ncbi:phosphatase PAP2 family protein [Maricurvus nonylphenolicus]|uniref:phosphatase PAP2 family protein n=1 Tax=Maricurvus nonylphenolicus TaxID=1008307 RepID=UPI0036F2CE42
MQFPTSTRLGGFLGFQLFALLLLASWLIPATGELWQQWNNATYYFLNGSLAANEQWSLLWAVMNNRSADLIPVIAIFPLLLKSDLIFKSTEVRQGFIGLCLLMFVMLIFRTILDKTAKTMGWTGNSPSLELTPFISLDALYPHLSPKDSAGSSFPGDHASVLIIIATYALLHKFNRWSLLLTALAIVFILPRLFSGAHWLTDQVIGGSLIAFFTIAWGRYTPYLAWATPRVDRQLEALFVWIRKFPIIGEWQLFAAPLSNR